MWMMIMALFPLVMSGGIPCCLLLGEHHGWQEMPACRTRWVLVEQGKLEG